VTYRSIPQTDPRASYDDYRQEIDQAVASVFDKGRYILGENVAAFESEFANFIGADHAIGVANGTDALYLALRALEIGEGDLVFTVSHTAVATVAAIELTGATPVLVDIETDSYTMDPQSLLSAIANAGRGTPRAVVPVHLYGNPCYIPEICSLAGDHGLTVIEDCAQSHGALLNGQVTGTFGDIASFSFYPTKNLGAIGDGGMCVTSNQELAERLRLLRQYGWRDRYVSEITGVNSRLDELQAAILRIKLRRLSADNSRRRTIAARYRENLTDADVVLPVERTGGTHVYHQFVIRHNDRDRMRAHLEKDGIGTLIHYAVPVHLQPAYHRLAPNGSLPKTEHAASEIVSLPMYPQLAQDDVDRACESIRRFTRQP
jgi:dTDP-4-amino-4,6-dideoxygalactose transaminase